MREERCDLVRSSDLDGSPALAVLEKEEKTGRKDNKAGINDEEDQIDEGKSRCPQKVILGVDFKRCFDDATEGSGQEESESEMKVVASQPS